MKANELMIGDWVNLSKGSWSENRQVELTDIEMIAESVYLAEPIPLTAEILEKNGFVYNAIPFVDGWEQFGLTLYRGGNGYRIDCGINVSLIIDYVHQLQNALRLCGIEKEIKL